MKVTRYSQAGSAWPSLPPRKTTAAFSLVEATMAVGLTLLTLGMALMLNGQQLKLVKSTSESNASSLLLQERIERFRLLSWIDFTNAAYLRDTFLPTRPDAAKFLPNVSERVRLDPFPPPATPDPELKSILVEYSSGSAPVALLTGVNTSTPSKSLSNQRQAKVEISVTWTGKDNRPRTRSYASIISIAGVNKASLPAFGGPTGDDGFFPTPTPTSTATPTPSPTGTPTPTPTPTPTGNGNGNGNNNGNSGGNGHGNGLGNSGGQGGKG